jgi:transcriptional regulator with XRE-family HTH domain
MTQGHLSMLTNGKRGYTQETLEAIADALKCDVGQLLVVDPKKQDAIWSIWEQADDEQRKLIASIANTILKTPKGG